MLLPFLMRLRNGGQRRDENAACVSSEKFE
jgi:hypothetical protein